MKAKMCRLLPFVLSVILFALANGQAVTSPATINSNVTVVEERDFTGIRLINDMLDIFNMAYLGAQWSSVQGKLTKKCAADMTKYFMGLEKRKLWALKMNDASGHYQNGFLYGNNYWTGSYRLCESIYIEEGSHVRDKPQTRQSEITSINGYTEQTAVKHENPPFMPSFYIVKVRLNDTEIAPNPRVISVAACLPFECTQKDISTIAMHAEVASETRALEILEVKIGLKEPYDFWNDFVFQLVLAATIFVAFLVILGTSYDLFLAQRYAKKCKATSNTNSESSSGIGCTTYDLSNASPDKKNSAIGISIPTGVNNNNSDEHLAIEQLSDAEDKMSIFEELILSFSVISNWRTISDKSVGGDTISCIHGMRALSMLWIILGHTCIILAKYADNMDYRRYVETIFAFQFIANGAYSVDTFFFISGFLVSFIYFRSNAKGKLEKLSKGLNEFSAGTLHFFGLLAYRFVRLTVPYLYMLGVVAVVMRYLQHESVFDMPANDAENCPKYWWRNIFYINTLFPVKDMCMLWSWYLANDTQFYIIGAIILIVAVKHFKIAAGTVFIFLCSAWATTTYIAFSNGHMPHSDDPFALFDKIYDKPWTRLGPYFIGMAVGWILFKTNCQIKFTRMQVYAGWTATGAIMFGLVFGLYNVELSPLVAAFYSSFSHSLWALAHAWITIACSTGYGGVIDNMLSAPIIYPFSRVTYCAYLVHPMVIRYFTLTSDIPMHLGSGTIITFFGQAIISYLLAFALSLAFEAPVVTALRILSTRQKHRVS